MIPIPFVQEVATGVVIGGAKVLAEALPHVFKLFKAKLYLSDYQIKKDIQAILKELGTIDNEAKEELRDRLEDIQVWLNE